ncbi:hypothetical protein AB990_17395 [Alkalihalobacillus pseudalcaliphilus]|nr:hypothetical protein AB990_17395 [Alkalihalobacillus pseudalcaliphilus]
MLYFLLIGILPLLIASYVMYDRSSQEVIATEQEWMSVQTDNIVMGMEEWLSKRLEAVRVLAHSHQFHAGNQEEQNQALTHLLNIDDVYESVVFSDRDGIAQAHTDPEQIGRLDISERQYFRMAREGVSSISNILESMTTGERIMAVAAPVRNDENEIVGVVSATLNFQELISQYFESENMLELGAYPVLVDRWNVIQYHSDDQLVGTFTTYLDASDELMEVFEIGKTEAGMRRVDVGGEQNLVTYAPLSALNFGVFLFTPLESVLGAADVIRDSAIFILITSVVLIIIIAYFIASSVSMPLKKATSYVKLIAAGDLTQKDLQIRSKDEVGELTQSMNEMKNQLLRLIEQVKSSASNTAATSQQLASSSLQSNQSTEEITKLIQKVAEGAYEQVEMLNESVSSVQEVAQGISEVAESTTVVHGISESTLAKANSGRSNVDNTIVQMNKIHEAVLETNEVTGKLMERSKNIEGILNTITSIADQTNLLSLNAAIEAARAGEHGKGFAVVANEVRKLAEESQLASKEIESIITEIHVEMNHTRESMSTVLGEVREGVDVADETKVVFAEIVEMTHQLSERISSVSATAEQMSAGAEEVTATMTEISQITKQATASTQEVAAASEEQLATVEDISSSAQNLSELAQELTQSVDKFRV